MFENTNSDLKIQNSLLRNLEQRCEMHEIIFEHLKENAGYRYTVYIENEYGGQVRQNKGLYPEVVPHAKE